MENISGVSKNYVFFNHSFEESDQQNMQSKENKKEAEMIIGFSKYLL